MCKIICLGKGWGGGVGGLWEYLYKKFSILYLFNARNVTFRTNFSVNDIITAKAI